MISQFFGKKQDAGGSGGSGGSVSNANVPSFEQRSDATTIENYNQIPQLVAPIWPEDSTIDLAMYISPSLMMPSLSSVPSAMKILEEKNFTIGNYSEARTIDTSFFVPKEVQNNATLWAHFYMALSGHQLDPTASDYDVSKANHFFKPLTQYLPKKKVKKMKMLLGSRNETEEAEEAEAEAHPTGSTFSSYYHPNFTLSVIPNTGIVNYPASHPALRKNINLEPTGARDESGQNGWYYPVLFMNTFWQLRDHMTELNSTVKELPMHVTLNNMGNFKYNTIATIDDNMKQTQKKAASGGQMPASGDGSEFEELKRILIDTNIYLLSTTVIVSIFHMLFEMLAFKSDISHWRQKKDNVGTSLRTILANVVMQAIIFLYLVDNSEGTSWMILMGQGFGIVLEAWKITKTVDVRVRQPAPGSRFEWLPYHITFEDKHKLSETEQKTQEYDQIAFKYLYMVAVPLLGAYAVYSLLYESHKSWYSFVITTLVGSVYAYGFLMMVPSLYINYRLGVSRLIHIMSQSSVQQ